MLKIMLTIINELPRKPHPTLKGQHQCQPRPLGIKAAHAHQAIRLQIGAQQLPRNLFSTTPPSAALSRLTTSPSRIPRC